MAEQADYTHLIEPFIFMRDNPNNRFFNFSKMMLDEGHWKFILRTENRIKNEDLIDESYDYGNFCPRKCYFEIMSHLSRFEPDECENEIIDLLNQEVSLILQNKIIEKQNQIIEPVFSEDDFYDYHQKTKYVLCNKYGDQMIYPVVLSGENIIVKFDQLTKYLRIQAKDNMDNEPIRRLSSWFPTPLDIYKFVMETLFRFKQQTNLLFDIHLLILDYLIENGSQFCFCRKTHLAFFEIQFMEPIKQMIEEIKSFLSSAYINHLLEQTNLKFLDF